MNDIIGLLKQAAKEIGRALWWSFKEMLFGFAGAIILIFAVTLVMGPMFGIALLVDNCGNWWFAAYIPYFIVMPLLLKPLAAIFGE